MLWGVTLTKRYASNPGWQAGMIKEIEWGVSGRPLAMARIFGERAMSLLFAWVCLFLSFLFVCVFQW
jgi:hypothetical protein